MINGGIYVTELDRAVDFYTRTLGLRLVYRAGEHWASIRAGGFEIGLHPAGSHTPAPGTAGAVNVGLSVDEPIGRVVSVLQARGVVFDGPVTDDGPVKLAFFADPDGNALYLARKPAGGRSVNRATQPGPVAHVPSRDHLAEVRMSWPSRRRPDATQTTKLGPR